MKSFSNGWRRINIGVLAPALCLPNAIMLGNFHHTHHSLHCHLQWYRPHEPTTGRSNGRQVSNARNISGHRQFEDLAPRLHTVPNGTTIFARHSGRYSYTANGGHFRLRARHFIFLQYKNGNGVRVQRRYLPRQTIPLIKRIRDNGFTHDIRL